MQQRERQGIINKQYKIFRIKKHTQEMRVRGDTLENSKSNVVSIIKEICKEEEIKVTSLAGDWAFRLEKNGHYNFILGYQFGLNLAVAQNISGDKSIASELLSKQNIPNVEHVCFMNPPMMKYMSQNGCWEEMTSLLHKNNKIVVKDNKGTGGDLVFLVDNQKSLELAAFEVFSKSDSLAISPYYEIEKEYRVIVLDGKVKLIFYKQRPGLIGDGIHTIQELLLDMLKQGKSMYGVGKNINMKKVLKKGEEIPFSWKHNLGQGAKAVVLSEEENSSKIVKERLTNLALQGASCLNLRFASVDIIKVEDEYKILEINSGVMMENFAGQSKENYVKAKEIYKEAIEKMLDFSCDSRYH